MTNEYEKGRKSKDNDPGKPRTHPGIQGPRTDLRKFLYQYHCCPARASLITLTNAPFAKAPADIKRNKNIKKSSNLPGGSPDEEDRPHNELKTSENEARES